MRNLYIKLTHTKYMWSDKLGHNPEERVGMIQKVYFGKSYEIGAFECIFCHLKYISLLANITLNFYIQNFKAF